MRLDFPKKKKWKIDFSKCTWVFKNSINWKICFGNVPTCVCSFMNLQILASRKHFSAPWKRTWEGLFPCVHTNMVDKFVFGFERSPVSGTFLPVAGVVSLFGAPNMIHRQMGHNLVHSRKHFIARFLWLQLVFVNPQTCVFLLNGGTHVTKKRPWSVGSHVHRAHPVHWRHVEGLRGREMIMARGCYLVVLLGTWIHFWMKSKSSINVMGAGIMCRFMKSRQ